MKWQQGRLRGARLLAELDLALHCSDLELATLQGISDGFQRLADADPPRLPLPPEPL